MGTIQLSEEATINAPAARVYNILADYERHHPNILPPAFSDLHVEQGGVGAGTVIRFTMTLGGRTRAARVEVTEPEPGRVLREEDRASNVVTTFTVMPDGHRARVRFDTAWQSSGGIGGLVERAFAPRLLRPIYKDELARLDRYAREQGD